MALRTTCIKNVKLKIIKIRTGYQNVCFYYSENLNWAACGPLVGHSCSKAVDRTNHNLLFVKQVKRNVPMVIVRLLTSWHRQQTMQVKWGTSFSSPFAVTNGVRQGGFWDHIYSLFILMNSQSSWAQQEWLNQDLSTGALDPPWGPWAEAFTK